MGLWSNLLLQSLYIVCRHHFLISDYFQVSCSRAEAYHDLLPALAGLLLLTQAFLH